MTPIMVNKNTESFDYLASKGAVNNKGRRMFDIAVETGINESGCFKSELRKHSIRGYAAPADTGKVNLSPC
jgi:hypothetical protein